MKKYLNYFDGKMIKKDFRFRDIWRRVKYRCLNHKNPIFKYYGGRGIKICKKWLDFKGFEKDMYKSYLKHKEKYGEKQTTIHRINNDGNYEKENCKWADYSEQAKNRRNLPRKGWKIKGRGRP